MKTIVTGGAGFIGSHLVDELIRLGHEVLVIDDFSLGKAENLNQHKDNPNLRILKKSICDVDKSDVEGFDILFHLAALPSVQESIRNPKLTHDINVSGTLNLLNLARVCNIEKFIFSSSCAVYGNQDLLPFLESMPPNLLSPYALHKLIGEQYCKLFSDLYNLKTISLRYFNVFGPRQDPKGAYAALIPKFTELFLASRSPLINGTGEQTRDFVYVRDVVNANICAMNSLTEKNSGSIINIAANIQISVNDIAKILKQLTNSSVEFQYGPAVIEASAVCGGITIAKNILNWAPQVSFEEGMKKTVDFFKNN